MIELLFDVVDDGVGRGTVGVGTNGNAHNTYFAGLAC